MMGMIEPNKGTIDEKQCAPKSSNLPSATVIPNDGPTVARHPSVQDWWKKMINLRNKEKPIFVLMYAVM